MSRTFKLYRLQQIDSQLDWLNVRLKEIQEILEEDQAIRQATERARKADEKKQAAHKALQKAEENVKQQRLKIEQSEASLYGGKITNPKELQDLQNEVAALKRYKEVLEERQLEAMLEEEEITSQHKVIQEELSNAKADFAEQSGTLIKEREKLLADAKRLKNERQAAANNIPEEDLTQYTKLRKTRRGKAVSKVVEKTCSACGSTLNASLLHAARSPTQIMTCDTCGRILYAG